MRNIKKLSNDQALVLEEFVTKNKHTANEIRRGQALLMLNSNYETQAIKLLTGYERKYVFRLRKRYIECGITVLLDKPKKTRAILTKGQLNKTKEMLESNTPRSFGIECDFWTTAILAHLLKELYNVQYKSKTSIRLLFKKSGFTYHKPDKQYKNRNQQVIDEWKEKTTPIIEAALKDHNTVVLVGDEMILTTQTTTQSIWLQKGSFPKIDVANTRKKRCIYGFLNVVDGSEHAFITPTTTSEDTCNMLAKLLEIYKDKRIVLVWDNASWHKSMSVRDFLGTTNAFFLINFPPYAPEENPQEHVWKEGRAQVTHNKFIENIDMATKEFVAYLNSTTFLYSFLGLSGLVKC